MPTSVPPHKSPESASAISNNNSPAIGSTNLKFVQAVSASNSPTSIKEKGDL